MTNSTYHTIQFRNAIQERDRHAQDVADSRELVTPFTVEPGVALSTVDLMPTPEPGEIKIGLTFPDGTQQTRCMPNRSYTHALIFAYAQHASRGIVPHGVAWGN